MWNKVADKAEESLKRGSRISITGKIVNRQYTDKDGNKRIAFEIQSSTFEFPTAA
jgi:single-strand DNA-binding protein